VARLVSIVVVYPVGTGLKSVVRVLEDVFNAELDISDHSRVGGDRVWRQKVAQRRGGGVDVDAGRIARKKKSSCREDWKAGVGQSVMSRAECAFSASGRTFGAHVAARKIAIYAMLEAAG